MKIDLTCPVELWQYAMPTGTDAECTFVMNNLSDKVVVSVQVTLNCFDQSGELLFRQTERVQGLKAGVGERFSVVVLPSEWQGVEGVDLVIEKVWFDDATIWRRGNAQLTQYVSNALPAGRALDELRFVAGKDAVGYPQVQEEAWLCICGRPNALDSQRCCRCERRRDAVFASFSRENVKHLIAAHEQKLADTARKAREENNILQENQEKKRAAKRRRRNNAIRWTTTLSLLTALAVISFVWLIPTARYNSAADLLAAGHYDQAREAFSQMGDYRDAATQALECEYQKAVSLYEQGEAESMEQAAEAFLALETYSDSAAQAMQVKYDLGCLYLKNAKYEQAVEKFQQIIDYQDSAEKLNETIYLQAEVLLEAGSFDAARILFAGLGEYSDARNKAKECNYCMAEAKLEAGDYQGALSVWNLLGDYSDTAQRIGECYYALAEEQLTAESYEVAGEWFLMAGDYSDAQERANECFYQLAENKREAGEYDKAIALFLRAPEYRNSEAMAQQCVYEKAEGLIAAGELAEAAALFESIAGYNDAQERMDDCRYQLAQAALEEERLADAEVLLDAILDHAEVAEQLQTVRYKLAEQLRKAGDYQSALERYELLGAYKDSRTKIKQCRYQLAKEALQAGRYDEAAELFTALGTYQDSKKLLSQTLKLQAGEETAVPVEPEEETVEPEEETVEPEETQTEEPVSDEQAARDAMKQKDYKTVTDILWDVDMENLPQEEKDLKTIFEEACLKVADQLYAAGEPYEAIPYYQRANAQSKLSRKAYLILGEWESATGKTASFRTDGTCDLMGETLYFRVSNYSLYTGTEPDDMTITHKLSVLTKTGMSLRDQRDGQDVLYKLSRVGEFELTQPDEAETEEASEAPQEPADETVQQPDTAEEEIEVMLVTEESNAADE